MSFSIDKYHFATSPILDGLPPEEFHLLKANMIRMEEKKGKLVFREGTLSKGIYFLRKGKVKIYRTNKEGKEQIVYIYRKDEAMGYRPILCEEPHPVSAATLEDCSITFIGKKYFLQVLDRSPILSRRLLTHLSHEFTVWINKLTVFGQQPVRERVALSLLILSEKYKKESKESAPAVIDLSRDDLANYAGTTVETLVRTLRYFKDEKIVMTQGRKIVILKPKGLEKLADFY